MGDGRKVVVVGAAGFLGSRIAAAFEASGARVLRIARRPVSGDGEWAALDLCADPLERAAEVLASAAVVVNAAGAAWGVTDHQMEQSNAELTRRLVAAVPRRARLIQLGSIHEYGPLPAGVGITEDTPTEPVGGYGRTKLAGSRAVLDAARAGELDGVVLRIANVSGPGTPRSSLLGMVAHHLTHTPEQELRLAPLVARRDFVDVRDVAGAVLAAALGEVGGQVVNVGRGEALSVRELVLRLAELRGTELRLVEDGAGAAPHQAVEWQRLDITRAGALLGWRPRWSVDESLRDLLAAAG
ncbi:NAD-dependent epimerase/dehydratase family protein [Kitasatospora azatica]|uniref:NAD-dependent epimerase/dehydratase family protein n=1 Tax=Kitasatospora azatica TaxID=58347 RepID=UPI00068A74C4|nr:NAD(P)-dependent oxidoreductase [Kitasatospora azatica]